jgi:multidrug efflux system outer membrane protein
VDFFGRLRSQKKSAFEDYLSSVEAMNIVRIAVITQTANAYAQYLLDRQILKIAEENLAALEEKLKLVELRKKNNIDSATTYLAAQNAAETARISVETYNKIVEQDKNALMALTGVFDIRSIPQDLAIDDIKINQSALDFVASENLLARPDIKQAEHNLIAANANIGAARAAFFPSISLTANYGYTSRQLNGLFDSKMWSLTPQINLPIFSGGRNIANLNIAEARKNLQVAQYEKTIQNAFRETLDSLAEKKALDNQKQSYTNIFKASQASYRISEKKNKVGAMSKMDVINAKISLLEAEKNHLSNKKELLANLITLYKVMGGGADYNETDSSK